ncbi:unnamed protein product [Effrenium voratum]|nr:unnamed protein product [Effrenium voratum]
MRVAGCPMAGAAGNATLPTPDVVFRQLGKDFAFEDVVVEHLVQQGLQSLALTWLEQQDTQERALWVQVYRQSQRPLGDIIKEVMQQRDAHWMTEKLRLAEQVRVDNAACFVLTQLQQHHLEKAMVDVGGWSDLDYDACVFQGNPLFQRVPKRRAIAEFNLEDIKTGQLCHADALVAEVAAQVEPTFKRSAAVLPRGMPLRKVLLASAAGAQALPWSPALLFKQEEVVAAFAKLYPAFCTETMQEWPMIEDLLQHPAFLRYTEWRLQAGLPVDEPLGPSHLDKAGRYATRVSAGRQDGAMAHKAALPPVVSFGLSPDAHFKAALEASARPSPLEEFMCLDTDLHFAADRTWFSLTGGAAWRDEAVGVMKELARRWMAVTKHLRQFQPPAVAAVTRQRHIALVGLLVLLLAWPDTRAQDWFSGFQLWVLPPPVVPLPPRKLNLFRWPKC